MITARIVAISLHLAALSWARDLIPLADRSAQDDGLLDDEPFHTRQLQRPFAPNTNLNRPPGQFDRPQGFPGFPGMQPNMAPPMPPQANSFPGRPPMMNPPQPSRPLPPPPVVQQPPFPMNGPAEPFPRQVAVGGAMISGLMAVPDQPAQSQPMLPQQPAMSQPMPPQQSGFPPGPQMQQPQGPQQQSRPALPPPPSVAFDPSQQGSEVVIRPPSAPAGQPGPASPVNSGPIPPGMMTGVQSAPNQGAPQGPAMDPAGGIPVPPQEVQAFAVPNDSQNAIPTGDTGGGAVDRLHDMTSGLMSSQQEMAERIHQQSEVIAFLMKSLVKDAPVGATPKAVAANNKPSDISTGFT